MDTPTRRDLFKYAVGATLASALPVSAQSHKGRTTVLPLVVDLIGPMAFTLRQNADVWFPTLTKEHEAGIGTSVSSIVLSKGVDYQINGPSPFLGPQPSPTYLTSGCTTHSETITDDGHFAQGRSIRVTLPMPHYIVALDPVMARIYPTGQGSTAACIPYAVGLRFIYDQYDLNGVPTLTPSVNNVGIIPLVAAPFETQMNMSIGHAPFDRDDNMDTNARTAFNELSKLLKLDLSVQIESLGWHCPSFTDKKQSSFGGPLHNCHGPIILVNLVR